MEQIVNQLKLLTPALAWEVPGRLKIVAGIGWLTFSASSCEPLRIRGKGAVDRFYQALVRMTADRQKDSELESFCDEMVGQYSQGEFSAEDTYHFAIDGQHLARLGSHEAHEILMDLRAWLDLLAGKMTLPRRCGYLGATVTEGYQLIIRLSNDTHLRLNIDNLENLARQIIAALGDDDSYQPGKPAAHHDGSELINIFRQLNNGGWRSLACGNIHYTLSHTALAHVAGLLMAARL